MARQRPQLPHRRGAARCRREDRTRPHRTVRRRRRCWTSSSRSPPQRVSSPANSIASWCATICHRRFRTGWAICCASNNYEIAPFLRTVFLSRDFYSPASIGTHIKGPVELIVSTYRRLGLKATPGMPDFNSRQRRPRAGAAEPAHRRGLEPGARVDHAGLPACARQFCPRACCCRT